MLVPSLFGAWARVGESRQIKEANSPGTRLPVNENGQKRYLKKKKEHRRAKRDKRPKTLSPQASTTAVSSKTTCIIPPHLPYLENVGNTVNCRL